VRVQAWVERQDRCPLGSYSLVNIKSASPYIRRRLCCCAGCPD